jgi:uncharacterized membrane protein YqjE
MRDAVHGPEVGTNTHRHQESIGDLLRELASESTALVRGEIELAKQEIRESITRAGRGLVFMGAAALVGWLALSTLVAAVVLALVPVLGGALAGLAVTVALAVTAGILVLLGWRRLKSTRFKPEKTLESLKEDKRWLKRTT